MIPDKVRNLFEFIEFLDTNKKVYAETYPPFCKKLLELKTEKSKLNPSRNYKDKQQYDAIQEEIDEVAPFVQNNVVNPIVDKLIGLGIWDGDETGASIWNNNAGAISELVGNFTNTDIEEVKKYKQMYLTFRAETVNSLTFLDLTFDCLDQVLKTLFDFFKDTDKNEFEDFEEKAIQANSFEETAKLIQKGHKKISLPIDLINPSKAKQNINETSAPYNAGNEMEQDERRRDEWQKAADSFSIDDPEEAFEIIKRFFEPEKNNDYKPLKEYIKDNYLNIHPNKFTLEKLKRIKRNINTWKLKLKFSYEAPDLQVFISEVIEDIDLKIDRFETNYKKTEPEVSNNIKKGVVKQPFIPKTFSELFNNPKLVEDCISLLRDTPKPCINDNNECINNKGFFVVWLMALEQKGMLNTTFNNDVERASTLNFNFKILNISASLFRSENSRAMKELDHFRNEIAAIKHKHS